METVIETPAYLAAAKASGMTAEEMAQAVSAVSANPQAGAVMQGTGGCRKVRLAGKGRGKSGGYRLITFYLAADGVYLLTVFGKGETANLSKAECNALHALVKAL
ncbi:MAG: addiction module toxin RelE [Caulobacteraceae bacterium]|nr:addiction module toxin RelE [Caulobacteraceae bacterium]